jgi:hypothetical protein
MKSNNTFKTTIAIKGASVDDVQRYYCIKNEALRSETEEEIEYDDEVLQFRASSIYVFVNDPENPLVPIQIPVGHVHQGEETFIPCKPSSKSVEVRLTKDETEVIENC